jgi:hypothetical protein
MIETAALFLAFAMIPYDLDLLSPNPRWNAVLLGALFGTAASLQEVTTGGPVVLVFGCVWLLHWLRRGGLRVPNLRDIATAPCAFGLPLLVTAIWTA